MGTYSEKELRSVAVTIIDEFGEINTTELQNELRNRLQPSGDDLKILANRNDDKFSQKVRNLVSHLSSSQSLQKYVDIDKSKRPTIFISRKFKDSIINISQKEKENLLKEKTKRARAFTGRVVDYEKYQRESRELGLAGEKFYLEIEKKEVKKHLGSEIASQIIHSSQKKGDGLGYDILSFDDKDFKYIEVKTTKGKLKTPFYMSYNEKVFYELHMATYYLVRVYEFDPEKNTGKYEIYRGDEIATTFDFETQSYRVKFKI